MEENCVSSHIQEPETTRMKSNNDCYFYYYSSCNKGSSCPFRHEPSSLRNETMCKYWLQGLCKKPNCIFRHMEINKPRDKIPCFFESQPGGCKKVHCSFFHSNVLDQPREEDVAKKPDLILPVRAPETDTNNERSSSQGDYQSTSCPEDSPCLPNSFVIPRRTVIVPINDAESDSESISVSPCKRNEHELSSSYDWELERLKEIQAEEGNLLGYSFEDHFEEEIENSCSTPASSIEESEEFTEIYPIDVKDAVHRRLGGICRSDEEEKSELHVSELDINSLIRNTKSKTSCLASRVLKETLHNNLRVENKALIALSNTSSIETSLLYKNTLSPKKSAKDRLSMPHFSPTKDQNSITLKLSGKSSEHEENSDFSFKIKSLDEIKREKSHKINEVIPNSSKFKSLPDRVKERKCLPRRLIPITTLVQSKSYSLDQSNSQVLKSSFERNERKKTELHSNTGIDINKKIAIKTLPTESKDDLGIKSLAEIKAERQNKKGGIKRSNPPMSSHDSLKYAKSKNLSNTKHPSLQTCRERTISPLPQISSSIEISSNSIRFDSPSKIKLNLSENRELENVHNQSFPTIKLSNNHLKQPKTLEKQYSNFSEPLENNGKIKDLKSDKVLLNVSRLDSFVEDESFLLDGEFEDSDSDLNEDELLS